MSWSMHDTLLLPIVICGDHLVVEKLRCRRAKKFFLQIMNEHAALNALGFVAVYKTETSRAHVLFFRFI
jgi:hypothetical protein